MCYCAFQKKHVGAIIGAGSYACFLLLFFDKYGVGGGGQSTVSACLSVSPLSVLSLLYSHTLMRMIMREKGRLSKTNKQKKRRQKQDKTRQNKTTTT
jgi:hypothetical protein